MVERSNPILQKMLERLFASLVSGPSMNCRPNASRQRVDFMQLGKLRDVAPAQALLGLFGPARSIHVVAQVPALRGAATRKGRYAAPEPDDADLNPEDQAALRAWNDQQKLLGKLRVMAEDARTYEQDTGVHALNIGYPLLSLPPGTFGSKAGVATRRILAPVAFIPVVITIKSGPRSGIEITCRGEGADLVMPNMALLAWLEQQTGQAVENPFDDAAGEDPWREISELARSIAERAHVKGAELFASPTLPESLSLLATPTADDDEQAGASIVPAAVMGLFPSANQGLLDDTRAMLADGVPDSPLDSFVRHGVSLDIHQPPNPTTDPAPQPEPLAPVSTRKMMDERLVTLADPCQTRAVRLSRTARGLVIHGPPGTGKSQTIANVIGDHLASNQRVLFVSDKRTALDVVADRLRALGLGNLVATVHDPQRDQRELYRSVREQLDGLADESLKPAADAKLAKIDAELQSLHDELTKYYRTLMGTSGGPGSFHHLMGQWLSESGDASPAGNWKALQTLTVPDFEKCGSRLKETLERGEAVDYANNPWAKAADIALRKFLSAPMDHYRGLLAGCRAAAQATDATANPRRPAFDPAMDLLSQGGHHREIAGRIAKLATIPQPVAAKWGPAAPGEVAEAQASLKAIASYRELVHSTTLDPILLAASPAAIAPEQLAAEAALLKCYAEAIETHAARYSRIRAAAPSADPGIILKWMTANAVAAQQARKRLTAAASIASAVESTTLDPSLYARVESTPLAPQQIVEWLGALSAYLDSSKSILGVLAFGKKKAAEPAVRRFGLPLSPGTAEQVRAFLAGVQNRSDLQNLLQAAAQARFEQTPDDAQLTTSYSQHVAVLNAIAVPNAATAATPASGTLDSAALRQLLGDSQRDANLLLERFGLTTDAASARRLADFLLALEARTRLVNTLNALAPSEAITLATSAEHSLSLAQDLEAMLSLFREVPAGSPVGDAMRQSLVDPAAGTEIIPAMQSSPQRASAILSLQNTLHATELFAEPYENAAFKALCRGKLLDEPIAALADRLDTLEGVLRVREGLAQLPSEIRKAASTLLAESAPAAQGYSAIRRNVLAGEIIRRLEASPELQAVDGHRLKTAFDRFGALTEAKKSVVRDAIQHNWLSRQKQRLLASTGSRLNAVGADLRRRLTTRGERAMRLRQVIKHGADVDGGDPLFDLRPIWMASPETVAQLFPRAPIFDVVIFDEASQCRLEEALPVLTRAHRVVIAGDPKQLPPTRFFESAVTTSEEDDADTEQALFESLQGEVEDLLTAALGLDVHQCYLDVHYRSRDADLIGFSNEHFYGSRLQAIPGHPRNRTRYAPITLYRVEGVYEKRRNRAEAERVCAIVHDLLKRANPPSIGIACFNMVQREEVLEALDDLATDDAAFAAKLAAARERRGPGGPEGLFVKNLENVQGDERDHIIISTTYGPDAAGKFRRQFGPLGTAGGGRRLNVLVTRARQELHVVTSIPRAAYTARPEIPAGTTPGGAWLLFAYLAYIEQLHDDYETNQRILENAAPSDRASVDSRTYRNPSAFATALARKLATEHNQSSAAPWGNDGFCIDVAMQHPRKLEDVTVGVLCDMTRYAGSDDPVEWDVFSTGVQQSQGWKLHRIWTPHFFRDPAGAMQGIMTAVKQAGGSEKTPDDEPATTPDKE